MDSAFSSRLAQLVVRRGSGLYLRLLEGVRGVSLHGVDHLDPALDDFHAGDSRLIIAFRHVGKADGPVLTTVFGNMLPRMHGGLGRYWVHFLFGDVVMDWAGGGARWLFPRIGALPVANQTVSRGWLDRVRATLLTGPHPLALAPEGQVNYYNHRAGDLATGLGHFLRWILNSGKRAEILPVHMVYRYANPRALADVLIEQSEEFVSREFDAGPGGTPAERGEDERLDRVIHALFSGILGVANSKQLDELHELREENDILLERTRDLLWTEASTRLGLSDAGRPIDRVLRFRKEIFDRLRAQNLSVPAVARRIGANWRDPNQMTETERLYRDQQVLDVLANFDPRYHHPISPDRDWNRVAEQALYVADIINRLTGGDVNSRYFPQDTRVEVRFGAAKRFSPGEDASGWVDLFED